MKNLSIETLPNEVLADVKSTLGAYDKVNVVFEYGEYTVTTGTMLKVNYGNDYASITITKNEIFTEDEQLVNYINNFHEFHINYKGKKDWNIIRTLNDYGYARTDKPVVKLDQEGNFTF